ncbi:MAG: hypothetical protein KGH63_00255 [Candidatus Micrarchaeota archaeon]|nr:hypothetical protein [Candidatus Micrarchaeota archaeon]
MLKPLQLQKVRLIGLLSAQAEALDLWQGLGVMHLELVPAAKLGLQEGRPIDQYDAISTQLVRMRAIKNSLQPVAMGPAAPVSDALGQAASVRIEDELLAIRAERERLAKAQAELEAGRQALERLAGLDVDFSMLPGALDYYLFSVATPQLAAVRESWSRHSWHAQWLTADDRGKPGLVVALVAVPKGVDCSAALSGVERLAIPSAVAGTPRTALLKMAGMALELENGQKSAGRRLSDLSEKYYPRCAQLEEALAAGAEMAQAAGRFGRSADCFYAEGWVKPGDWENLRGRTERKMGAKVAVELVEAREHRGAGMPTVLENPAVAGPFQFLVEFLGLPQHDELDPSVILLFTIPLIYGLIVGDAGYALLSFLLAFAISMKAPKGEMLWQFSRLWMVGAIPSFVFGVLFDEYFGFSHQALLGLARPLYAPVLHRVENVQMLLLVSILVGWVHIALGFVLGAVNEWNHNRKHAYAKLSWLPIQVGGTLAIAAFMLNAASFEVGMVGAGLLVAGMAALAWAEGPMALVEVPGLSANIMSYCRIAAVGVGGVILAEAINQLLGPDPSKLGTPGGAILFVIISIAYVMAHVANTVLAMFESLIHGARLNVVEFFGKFYHGGGIKFQPFAATRKYTRAQADEKISLDY